MQQQFAPRRQRVRAGSRRSRHRLDARAAPRPAAAHPAPEQLVREIDALHAGFEGRIGIAVRGVDSGWTAEAGGRQFLPQQSVSKLWVAITLLDLRDQGKARSSTMRSIVRLRRT